MSQKNPRTSLPAGCLNQPGIPAPRRPAKGESRAIQIMENRGNEAKNLLKTNDITFLDAVQFALFSCKLALIDACNEQKRHTFRKRTETCKSPGKAGTAAGVRLHRSAIALRDSSLPGGGVR